MRSVTRSVIAACRLWIPLAIAALSITAAAWPRAHVTTISGAALLDRATVARLTNIPSHNRSYRASLGLTSDSVWTLHLRSASGAPVPNASLVLEAWMPDEANVAHVVPIANEYVGNGDYRVRRLELTRGGWWNVKLEIATPEHVDSLAFNLLLR